ncbi:secreted protein, partial [gut metagenome]
MKKMKKFVAVITALVLACSLSTVAFAASQGAPDVTPNIPVVNNGKVVVGEGVTVGEISAEDLELIKKAIPENLPADASNPRIEKAFS